MLALLAALVGAVAPIRGGNALTLPAARHMVRMETGDGRPATWLLAIQQDGVQGRGLGFWRSNDDARTWSYLGPIQNDWSERDTPDLLPVGKDIALVYSFEGPTLDGSSRHDVYFQWWRWDGAGNWNPSSPVVVFDSGSSATAFYRGELAIDSAGRIWVQAFKLESDGSHTAAIAVSTNGGATFSRQPDLGRTSARGGGRILSLGSSLLFVWGSHGCCDAAQMRTRADSDPLSSWSAARTAFSEGLYHGAALSAVADDSGGMHLVYKDHTEKLYYRHFDGSGWSARTQLESTGDWATQPAVTRLGSDLVIFYNHPITTNTDYRWVYRTVHGGSIGSARTLDASSGFKGYPASPETLPTWFAQVPCVFGKTPNASTGGDAVLVLGDAPAPTPSAGGTDGGTPGTDGGAPGTDAGVDGGTGSDAGSGGGTDGGPPPAPGALLFSDDFNRSDGAGLGPRWTVVSGRWITDSRANADQRTRDLAVAAGISCADCRIDARMVGFGTAETGLTLRGQPNGDRYDLIVTSSRRLLIRRWRAGSATVLGDVASGIADLGAWASFAFTVSGTNPVTLTGSVAGAIRLTVADAAPDAIVAAGSAGLNAVASGVWFDDFKLTALGTGGDIGGGGTDGGSPDAGTSDAGTSDGGSADAGTTDGGSSDAGSADAGSGSGGTGGGGSPVPGAVLFADDFNRSDAAGLGPRWRIIAGAWITDSRANADRKTRDLAVVNGITCADCRIDARLVGFETAETGVSVRSQPNGDCYDAIVTSSGRLRVRRWRGGTATVLGDVASGIANLNDWAPISFAVFGTAPVTLSASVNGSTKLTVADGSGQAILAAGSPGLLATAAGVWFDDFKVTALGPSDPGGTGGSTDGGSADAGSADGGTIDGGTIDGGAGGGSADAGPADAGSPGGGTGATRLQLTEVFAAEYQILAIDGRTTIYGTKTSDWGGRLYASSDARSWSAMGSAPGGIRALAPLSDGTLIAQVRESDGNHLVRSSDQGRTWTEALSLGDYYALTTHSFAELDGTAYFIEYQVFTRNDAPIHLWASTDSGRTWSLRYTFQGHRHAHGMATDAARHALWAWFGDTNAQSGTYRSTDGGRSWALVHGSQVAGQVDATVLPDGSIVYGQDITYLPQYAHVARLTPEGALTEYLRLPGPSYSTHALASGGYVMGVARESGGDDYPDGNVSAYVYTSMNGVDWEPVLSYRRRSASDDVRADVYWELPDGDLLLEVRGSDAFSSGVGYKILHPTAR